MIPRWNSGFLATGNPPHRGFHTVEAERRLRSQFNELRQAGSIGAGTVLSQVPSWGNTASPPAFSSSSAWAPLECDLSIRTRSPTVQAASWLCCACTAANGLESTLCTGRRPYALPAPGAPAERACGHAMCPRCRIVNASGELIRTVGGQNLMRARETELAGWECGACGRDNRFVSSDLPCLERLSGGDGAGAYPAPHRPMRCSASHCLHTFDEKDNFINFFGERVAGPLKRNAYKVIG